VSRPAEPQAAAAGEAARAPQPEARDIGGRRGLFSAGTVAKLAIIAVLAVWPFLYPDLYTLSWMTFAGISLMVVVSVYLIIAQAGQLSFGHAAFYGVGAYTASILAIRYNVPTLLALLAGAALAGVIALVIGRPVLRLRYFYLALATIGLGIIFSVIVIQAAGITGGTLGLAPVPPLSLFGFSIDTYYRQYYLVWIVALLMLLFTERALGMRVGRALRALATSEIAAETLGVRTANWKLIAFVASAVFCAIAGSLYAFTLAAITPSAFAFSAAILPIIMMLIGGGGTIWGGLIGAVLMTWLSNQLSSTQQWSGVIYSIIMILLLLFLPMGITGFFTKQRLVSVQSLFRRQSRAGSIEGAAVAEAEGSVGAGETQVALPTYMPEHGRDATAAEPDSGTLLAELRRGAGDAGEELLRVDGVSVDFGGLRAVSQVSMTVRTGQIAALIGPNGAGKTTLFNVVSRLQRASEGRVFFAGQDITHESPAASARLGMARTFQNLRIFENMDVLENVLVGCHRHEKAGFVSGGLGLPGQRREEQASRLRAMDALRLVGLDGAAHQPAASLPYGRQRLVEIARALASEPRLLLLDEPAAGMNAVERAYLVDRLRRIREAGVTVLLVEHDIELVMGLCDWVTVLDYGKCIADGAPDAVKADEAVIAAYLGVSHEGAGEECDDLTGVEVAAAEAEPAEKLLEVRGLSTRYGAIQALRDVSFDVPRGEIVAVLGANGAGKTTLLHTISGVLRPSAGSIVYAAADITRLAPARIVGRGVCQVPEGRRLFPSLSVEDNLRLGTSGRSSRASEPDDLAYVFELFPVLGERRRQPAGTLSGGEQQMVAIGRALMGKPDLLLLDEPSMGLAPLAVERIFEALKELNDNGLTMLMVEQNAEMAFSVADRAVVLQTGSVALTGPVTGLRDDARVRECYLGQA
jgi:ABC-type branched-subunit amino acid transport system ATPase component/ABC-type branched-subunit amino acid transport system permease subunit